MGKVILFLFLFVPSCASLFLSVTAFHALMSTYRTLKDTVNSQAKGTIVNLVQVHCCVGQQMKRGERFGSTNNRTIPCFPHPTKDTVPTVESRGFVASSFSSGLNPAEMHFHFSSSWESLMDTSVRTSIRYRIPKFFSFNDCFSHTMSI